MRPRPNIPQPGQILTPMRLTRRQALRLGVVGTAGGLLFLSGCGGRTTLSMRGPSDDDIENPPVGAELQPPPEVVAQNGVLQTTLTAAAGSALIDGAEVSSTSLYNSFYPGQTWRVSPGDTFRVDLDNQLDTYTNLHWHGMHVSPNGNADNIFLQVDPGETFSYEVAIPENHDSGAYWYHPHFHTTVDQQVYGGLGGLIIVEGGWRDVPGIREATEKVMVLKDVVVSDGAIEPTTFGVTSNELWTINGQVNPRITAAPGERQLWRVANLGNDPFFRFALEGHEMHVVATDGVGVPRLQTVSEWTLPPASRVEFLVDPAAAGTFRFQALEVNEGQQSFAPRTLATFVVEGEPVGPLPELPEVINDTLVDFRQEEPDVFRQLVFNFDAIIDGDGESTTGNWLICDLTFNAGRVDVMARLNDLEEWELLNIDTEDHPFHIHQNDFQVVAINGVPQDFVGYRDTVTIPRGGSIKIRQRYLDFTGKWVYHCHVLFHEDHGMMGTIQVI